MENLLNSSGLWASIVGSASPFETNAAINPAAAASSPVITNANGTSSLSPSWLDRITGTISSLGTTAAAVLPGIAQMTGRGNPNANNQTPAQAASAGGMTLSIIALIGGAILFVVFMLRAGRD